ncbi:hypothetical protein Hanom_Chr17g01540401 [Helianthus anomalus]
MFNFFHRLPCNIGRNLLPTILRILFIIRNQRTLKRPILLSSPFRVSGYFICHHLTLAESVPKKEIRMLNYFNIHFKYYAKR